MQEHAWAHEHPPTLCYESAYDDYVQLFANVETTFEAETKYLVLGSPEDNDVAVAGTKLDAALITSFYTDKKAAGTACVATTKGTVVFSTAPPSTNAATGCRVDDQVTSMDALTPVYAYYIFKSKQGSDQVWLGATKDGQSYLPFLGLEVSNTQGFDCLRDPTDLSKLHGWGPGTYRFTLILMTGQSVVAEGTITVT